MWEHVVDFFQRANVGGTVIEGVSSLGGVVRGANIFSLGGSGQSRRSGSANLGLVWPQLDPRSQHHLHRGGWQRQPPQLPLHLGMGPRNALVSQLHRRSACDVQAQRGLSRQVPSRNFGPAVGFQPEAAAQRPPSSPQGPAESAARGTPSMPPATRSGPQLAAHSAPTTPTRGPLAARASPSPSPFGQQKHKPPPPPPAPHPFPQDELSSSQRSTTSQDWLSASQRGAGEHPGDVRQR